MCKSKAVLTDCNTIVKVASFTNVAVGQGHIIASAGTTFDACSAPYNSSSTDVATGSDCCFQPICL